MEKITIENKTFLLKNEDYPVFKAFYRSAFPEDALAFGTVTDGKPSALALLRPDDIRQVWWLDWLYVEPSLRGKGIGTSLIYGMAELIDDGDFSDTICTVCVNSEVRGFLEGLGFVITNDTGYTQFTTRLGSIETGKKAKSDETYTIRRIDELSEDEKRKLEEELAEDESGFWPISGETYLHQSLCAYGGEELKALLLLSEEEEAIVVSFVYSKKGHASTLMGIIQQAEEELTKAYGADAVIKATSVNEKSTAFIKKVFPEATEAEICFAELDILDL